MNNKLGKHLEDLQTDDMIRLFGSSISEKDLEDPELREIILAFLNDRIKEDIYEIEYMISKLYFNIRSLLIHRCLPSNYITENDLVAYKASEIAIAEYLYHLRSYKNECKNTWNSIDFGKLEEEHIKSSSDSPENSEVKRLLSINYMVDNIISADDIEKLIEELMKYERF